MELKAARHLWGFARDWETGFADFASLGYEGIDAVLPVSEKEALFRDLLERHGFFYIAQIGTVGQTLQEHLDSFRAQVERAVTFEPLLINAHSGRDAFSAAESREFFREALQIQADCGVPVVHETHRSRVLYNPWITRDLLREFPEMKLCCDFSHWINVCERLIHDQVEIIRLCAQRCLHIHARVGYEHGPQVPDPRAPEYAAHLEAHESWWEMIWYAQQDAGRELLTFTPEFGPPRYLHTLPFTDVPVTDLEEICNWQMRRQKEQFGAWSTKLKD